MHTESEISEKNAELALCEGELEKYKTLFREESTLSAEQARRIADLQRELDEMKHTVSWRITSPMRLLYRASMKIPPVRMGAKVLKNIRRFGIKYTYKKARTMMRLRRMSRGRIVYTAEALEEQRRAKFDTPLLFSVMRQECGHTRLHCSRMRHRQPV